MICSSVNRVRFISVILHKIDGLHELYIGTAAGEQVSPAPRHSQSKLLCAALSWHAQMSIKADSASGSDKVDRMIRSVRRTAASVSPKVSLAPGTRLLREWQGQTHHVTVLINGFEYAGQNYRSLTAIARLITGTAWSGPLFFGLRS